MKIASVLMSLVFVASFANAAETAPAHGTTAAPAAAAPVEAKKEEKAMHAKKAHAKKAEAKADAKAETTAPAGH